MMSVIAVLTTSLHPSVAAGRKGAAASKCLFVAPGIKEETALGLRHRTIMRALAIIQ